MKLKLTSAAVALIISSPALSSSEYHYTDNLNIKLSEKNNHAHLTEKMEKPVLHIEQPDNNGVSHNLFDEFNVGKKGLFINNKNKARVIINEVTADTKSVLAGNISVVFNRADLIIANPNGIICNGCSTTNVLHTTLITGKITDDSNKKDPLSYQETDGTIQIMNTSDINRNKNSAVYKNNKLSLIANKIIIKKSTVNLPDVFIKTTKTKEYISHKTGQHLHTHTPGTFTDETIEERKPSLLYIDKSSSVSGKKLKIEANSGIVNNYGNIKSYGSNISLSEVFFSNSGNITSTTSDITSLYSSMYNQGNIIVQKLNISFDDTYRHFDIPGKKYIPAQFALVNDGLIKGGFAGIDSYGADLKNNGEIDMWGRTTVTLHNEYDVTEHKLVNNGTISNQY